MARLSMNTSLRDARIFDDDSWDAETAGFIVKDASTIKSEKQDSSYSNQLSGCEFTTLKKEPLENYAHVLKTEVKHESIELANNYIRCENETVTIKTEIKQEPVEKHSIQDIKIKEEFNFENSESSSDSMNNEIDKEVNHMMKLETPIKNELKPDILFEQSLTPSPFNKELFKHFSIQNDSPQPKEENHHNSKMESRKSVKRTVFQRGSPYKRYYDEESSTKISAKERLGPRIIDNSIDSLTEPISDEEFDFSDVTNSVKERLGSKTKSELNHPTHSRKRMKTEDLESDPAILARRQKQIDYGKNTIGYDNYIKQIPRKERELTDPKTPNKFLKYSRRAWDGLIKQWRLKLHKYDPSENQDCK